MRELPSYLLERRVDVFQAFCEEEIYDAVLTATDLHAWKRRLQAARTEARARELRSRRAIPVALRRRVLAEGNCAYCGDFATCVDHIHPVSRGGTNEPDNLAPACRRCNEEKLDWSPEEWQAWRVEMGWPWPPVAWTSALAQSFAAATN